jgi:tetratricopeptide (TPR) repeat protein
MGAHQRTGDLRQRAAAPQPTLPATANERKSIAVLKRALALHDQGKYGDAAKLAAEAADLDAKSGAAYNLIASSLEHLGLSRQALDMYGRALACEPDNPDMCINLGLAAYRMRMFDQAEKAFKLYVAARPHCSKGYTNLGTLYREQGRMDEAVDILRNAIYMIPAGPDLWNALGAAIGEMSDWASAMTFYREALRLDPGVARYWHNLGYALLHTGPMDEAVACFDKALAIGLKASEENNVRYARCMGLFLQGKLSEAWPDFDRRLELASAGPTAFADKSPLWRGEDLTGKTLLVMGEQGLGDEIMFAETIPDLVRAVGPDGKLIVACEHRLALLYARSFPQAVVGPQLNSKAEGKKYRLVPWAHADHRVDYHAPIGNALERFRPTVSAFGKNGAFLKPDPEKVAAWRMRLAQLGPGLNVGVCWRSMMLNTQRRKFYSPLELWAKPLATHGVRAINLQYGDCAAEIAEAREKFGVEIVDFPDLDLKNDLDGNAALCAALDVVISAPTAAAALSAAVGTETWFLVASMGWPQFGTDHYPWYPKTRVFTAPNFADWPVIMDQVTAELSARATLI